MLMLQLVLSAVDEVQVILLRDVCVLRLLNVVPAVWCFGTWFDVGYLVWSATHISLSRTSHPAAFSKAFTSRL